MKQSTLSADWALCHLSERPAKHGVVENMISKRDIHVLCLLLL